MSNESQHKLATLLAEQPHRLDAEYRALVVERLADYEAGELSDDERVEIAEMILNDPEVSQIWAEMQENRRYLESPAGKEWAEAMTARLFAKHGITPVGKAPVPESPPTRKPAALPLWERVKGIWQTAVPGFAPRAAFAKSETSQIRHGEAGDEGIVRFCLESNDDGAVELVLLTKDEAWTKLSVTLGQVRFDVDLHSLGTMWSGSRVVDVAANSIPSISVEITKRLG